MTNHSNIIDGKTKLLGIVGQNISHTMSPAMHNRAAKELGTSDIYVPFDLSTKAVQPFLKSFWDIGGVGLNITSPHKKTVAKLFQGNDLSSVNTLYREDLWWKPASTDGEGFALGLKRIEKSLSDYDEVIVMGNGGATLAILEYISTTPKTTVVLRRDDHNDDDLIAALPKDYPISFKEFEVDTLSELLSGKGGGTLLLQTTSAPLHGDDLARFIPALDNFTGTLVDIVYKTPSTIYSAAIAKDLTTQDGEAMLIEQARLSQKLWWGRSASYESMAKALRGK